ncbi:hypothetical protein HELRODRAFT_159589 [Helobdella robusta]|uniref:Uncharacterized protein n=1 Tax=Helobdella robusta TaxID=6412 RepID=T1EP74_HELRO|nr:hypothetical protein HELRODRAFT_159589 [Helobdella robusta]ESO12995.1 hypothetical protein HELRODRAFT_159589 [Helobdella robusta]
MSSSNNNNNFVRKSVIEEWSEAPTLMLLHKIVLDNINNHNINNHNINNHNINNHNINNNKNSNNNQKQHGRFPQTSDTNGAEKVATPTHSSHLFTGNGNDSKQQNDFWSIKDSETAQGPLLFKFKSLACEVNYCSLLFNFPMLFNVCI